MQTQELAQWLGLSTSAIRLWSRGEFKQYLSPQSQGGEGRTRYFSDLDARIIAYIALLKHQAVPTNEIHSSLKRLQAESWQDLPSMPPSRITDGPIPTMPREAAETAIVEQRRSMQREVAILQTRIGDLESRLENERQDREQIQTELMQAREELGQLRGQLSERQPTAYWMRIVVVVVLVAVLVTAAIALLLTRAH